MKEFTERHHAYIAAVFYKLLTEKFGKRGEQAFVLATQRYGEQRGSRMAQRAIRDGKPLDFANYKAYGEWVNTQSIIEEMGGNQSEDITYAPDYTFKVTVCPWARQFADMDMKECGALYCTHIDRSIARGFNPYLVYEVPQNMNDREYCIQALRGANFEEGKIPGSSPENRKEFDYHCAHIYYTFSDTVIAIFGEDGEDIAQEVYDEFSKTYGSRMAWVLAEYGDEDFNYIG
ncbi:MAG: L-2-amino-thiazoline-4-carboxylic acid hydrolase [Clostridia bacterium]|nr:L-2-amino-thiazoline-4-carboxylic acid hydrolase [Clostridia bacterium]